MYIEDGEIIITDEAPDYVLEWIDHLGDNAETMLNYLLTLEIDDKDPLEYDVVDAKELAEDHKEQMEVAVADGDIEAAQHHQTLAEQYDQYYESYFNNLESHGSLDTQKVKETIAEIEEREETNGAPISLIRKNLTEIDDENITEIIDSLKQRGEVYEPRTDQLRVT